MPLLDVLFQLLLIEKPLTAQATSNLFLFAALHSLVSSQVLRSAVGFDASVAIKSSRT
jgi:hypothetical protein